MVTLENSTKNNLKYLKNILPSGIYEISDLTSKTEPIEGKVYFQVNIKTYDYSNKKYIPFVSIEFTNEYLRDFQIKHINGAVRDYISIDELIKKEFPNCFVGPHEKKGLQSSSQTSEKIDSQDYTLISENGEEVVLRDENPFYRILPTFRKKFPKSKKIEDYILEA